VLRKSQISRFCGVMAIIFTIFLYCYVAKDAAAFEGSSFTDIEMEEIQDLEMEEIQGGLQLPGGNCLYFGMEVTRMEFMSYQEPGSMTSTEGLDMMDQYAFSSTNVGTASLPGAYGSIKLNIGNNVGYTNVAVAVGDHITQYLYHNVNLDLAFFEVNSPNQIKPILSNWKHMNLF